MFDQMVVDSSGGPCLCDVCPLAARVKAAYGIICRCCDTLCPFVLEGPPPGARACRSAGNLASYTLHVNVTDRKIITGRDVTDFFNLRTVQDQI